MTLARIPKSQTRKEFVHRRDLKVEGFSTAHCLQESGETGETGETSHGAGSEVVGSTGVGSSSGSSGCGRGTSSSWGRGDSSHGAVGVTCSGRSGGSDQATGTL